MGETMHKTCFVFAIDESDAEEKAHDLLAMFNYENIRVEEIRPVDLQKYDAFII